jgi:hypothetical protein
MEDAMFAKLALPLLLSWFVSPLSLAQPAPTNTIVFPMVGVGFDQTFQVSIAASSCVLLVAINDSNGDPVETVTLDYGELGIKYVMQNGNKVVPRPGARAELYATVTPQPTTTGPCVAQGSVEIYNNLTHVTSVAAPQLPEQPPGPPYFGLGPVGVGAFQTVRLNVLAHPPDPCIAVLGFDDANGNPVGSTLPVSLNPGQAAFLDLPSQLVLPNVFGRAEVLPRLTPLPGAAPAGCATSVEVYDQLTGWSRVFYPPGPPQILQPP